METQGDISVNNMEIQDACILPRVIFIRATISGLLYPLLPFALLQDDPVLEVQQYIRMNNVDVQNGAKMRAAWNTLFNSLSLEQIYFVGAWNSVPEASPRLINAAGMTFVIASCGPHHKRWLTTRPMWHNGELVVWSEPINMHPPQFQRVITLSEANMIRLAPALELPESRVA